MAGGKCLKPDVVGLLNFLGPLTTIIPVVHKRFMLHCFSFKLKEDSKFRLL